MDTQWKYLHWTVKFWKIETRHVLILAVTFWGLDFLILVIFTRICDFIHNADGVRILKTEWFWSMLVEMKCVFPADSHFSLMFFDERNTDISGF